MKLLVTGGAGYVGGVCATVLVERGHEVVVLDDLHWADPWSVDLLGALLRRPPPGQVLLALGEARRLEHPVARERERAE